jgi:hypothetical protein
VRIGDIIVKGGLWWVERERDIEYVMGCEGELKMFDLFAFGCSDYT